MRLKPAGSRDEPQVLMSPLIDAVFLLLIFFLVATMFRKEDRDINITPPESRSAVKLLPEDDTLVLGIDAEGEMFWQGQSSTANEFHERLRALALVEPGKRIRLDADEATEFWRVAEVMDMAQFRGLKNVGIRTYDNRYNQR